MRRSFDFLCAALGLLTLAPLFAAIALALKLQDGGPVFYAHRRAGRNFRPFRLLKFRTMTPHADSTGGALTVAGDARVTAVGRFLRRYKLDELPQLVNVLKGDMQLVGPRPEWGKYVHQFRSHYAALLRERPGITDPASLAFRHEEDMLGASNAEEQYLTDILPRKLELSRRYRAERTFLTDLEVLVRSVLGLAWRPRDDVWIARAKEGGP